jgi:hypothetical protein
VDVPPQPAPKPAHLSNPDEYVLVSMSKPATGMAQASASFSTTEHNQPPSPRPVQSLESPALETGTPTGSVSTVSPVQEKHPQADNLESLSPTGDSSSELLSTPSNSDGTTSSSSAAPSTASRCQPPIFARAASYDTLSPAVPFTYGDPNQDRTHRRDGWVVLSAVRENPESAVLSPESALISPLRQSLSLFSAIPLHLRGKVTLAQSNGWVASQAESWVTEASTQRVSQDEDRKEDRLYVEVSCLSGVPSFD